MVGLGNPGGGYADTRHNAGFWLADALAARWRLPRFRREPPSLATGGRTPCGPVHILKPQTFMNDSGRALSGLRPPEPGGPLGDLLVLVDEVALPVGYFRIRSRGSAGGHNGLKSVEATLGTREYARLRIGVGPSEEEDLADHVLAPMPRAERAAVEDLMPEMCEAVECWMTEGAERAMARYNRRVPPAE
ncbi:MAG TPA: aminoacyl-tRNA hydrolase [Gemmatimonadales bacterium]|nr:aminoacyl-tRNA hydrolase [Gemmatimonadales bacterium]